MRVSPTARLTQSRRNADYRTLFQIDRRGALRELRHLATLEVLSNEGAKRGTRYEHHNDRLCAGAPSNMRTP